VTHSSLAPVARTSGFTLIELLITVGIIAILAGIALPSYSTFVMRSKIIDATTKLGDLRTDMEKGFMDRRTYIGPLGCASQAIIDKYNADPASNFTFRCDLPPPTPTTYTLRADGVAARGMNGFAFTINEQNIKTTVSVPAGWALPAGNCWATRKDGSCT
jgi:type IV pilus assembly protein PilE